MGRGNRTGRKLTVLDPIEEQAWQFAFEYHMDTGKQGQDEAARHAWRDIRKQFPRLQPFDGTRLPTKREREEFSRVGL